LSASIIASVVTGGTNSHQTVSEELNNVATDFVSQGVVGTFTSGSPNTGAFAVTQDASPDMGVTVLSGRAYIAGTPSGQDAQVLSARMTSNYTSYTINSNSSGSTKYDWIYLKLDATKAAAPASDASDVITLFTSRSTSNASDNGSPPTYGLLLAVVTVANGASSITNGNITDKRVQSALSVQSTTTTGWQTLSFPLTYGANNGDKEFTVTSPNDMTSVLSPGMKLKISRSVTPPTQCMAFTAASSQYATKASPSGLSFTSAFTCEAWVYLNSYTGANNTIISRRSGSVGAWWLRISPSGQVGVGYGDGSGNFSEIVSYRSIPLKRWVHVAGVVASVTSKTGVIYINGSTVSATLNLGASTTLTQAGNLSVGAYGAGTGDFMDGYVSEARVWSVAQTQASIQANMAINLVGNETNLVALFQGSGNFNDSTSNANNLTATNGAISTQANNPYNATEYATILTAAYSNPTTTLTLYAGDQNTIPNQTLNSPNYSLSHNPYGFPANLKRYRKFIYVMSNTTTTSTTAAAINGLSIPLTIPSDACKVTIRVTSDGWFNSGANFNNGYLFSGTSLGTLTTQLANVGSSLTGANNVMPFTISHETFLSPGSIYINAAFAVSAGTATISGGTGLPIIMEAEVDI
jgi:hypothetical protein